jgi:hypothetical protein
MMAFAISTTSRKMMNPFSMLWRRKTCLYGSISQLYRRSDLTQLAARLLHLLEPKMGTSAPDQRVVTLRETGPSPTSLDGSRRPRRS